MDRPSVAGCDLLEPLGRGGMGRVYVARERASGRLQAVKLLPAALAADPTAVDRFRREFRAVSSVQSEHVVPVYQYGAGGEGAWFSMALLDGDTLASRFAHPDWDRGPRPVARLMAGVARGLAAAHDRQVFHLDLKPSNVIIRDDGTPVLIDFGCARLAWESGAGSAFGQPATWCTPAYAAPEILSGTVAGRYPRADVYSLGAVLAEALTGLADRSQVGQLDRDLRAVCERCLDPAPERRYGSAAEVVEELERYLGGFPVSCRRVGWGTRQWYRVRRHRAASVVAFGLAVAAVAGIWVGVSAHLARREHEAAERAREDARERAADAARRTDRADAAVRRGDWDAAVAEYTYSLAVEQPDRPRLELAILRARFAANQLGGLAERIEECLVDDGLVQRRAELLLLRGELRLTDADGREAGRADLAAALACDPPLPAADAGYTRGLLAETVVDTLTGFRAAIGADPAHHPARAALVMGLILSGRLTDARTELRVMRSLFPMDRFGDLAEALLEVAAGNDALALAAADRFADRLPAADREPFRRRMRAHANLQAKTRAMNAKPGRAELAGQLLRDADQMVEGFLHDVAGFAGPVGLPQPVVARLFEVGRIATDASLALLLRSDASKMLGMVEPHLASHPDAALFLLSATFHLLKAQKEHAAGRKVAAISELRAVADRGEAAAAAPTAFPAGPFAFQGRVLACVAMALLGTEEFGEPDDARLRKNLRELVREGQAWPELLRDAASVPLRAGIVPVDQARLFLADWGLTAGIDPDPWERLAVVEEKSGNRDAARAAAGRAVRLAPADAALRARLARLLGPVGGSEKR